MKLILSKIIRKYKKEQLPYTCYAFQHFPQSLEEKCDCIKFCKFPPRGNLPLTTSQSIIKPTFVNPPIIPTPIILT